jgi:thiol-disulfide isomerase/thioredoxin
MSDTRQSTEHARPVSLDDEADLEELVASEPLVLVEFYTEGCGICQSMEPVLGNVAKTTDAVVAIINPRDDPPLVDRFAVQNVPLFVVFVDGEPVARRAEGFIGGEDLQSWLAEFEA